MALVTKLPGEPIVIVSLSFPLHRHEDEVRRANEQVAAFLEAEGPLFRIINLDTAHNISVSDILLWLHDHKQARTGSIFDPRVTPVLVGRGPMIDLWDHKVAQRTGVQMARYASLDDALLDIRNQIYSPVA